MEPKTKSDTVKVKKKLTRIMIEKKKEIIAKYECGVRVSDLAIEYGISSSTVCTILKKKEAIKAANVAKGVTVLAKQRSQAMEDMEKLLLIWLNEELLAGNHINEGIIRDKAKRLHEDLVKKKGDPDGEHNSFKASRGWFLKFKRRSGFKLEDGMDGSQKTAEEYSIDFSRYVKTERFLPQQVFNCDETGMFWKKMPKRTYLTLEEKALPGHKPMKDRFTLLLCGNASGDFKVKPLLVYHSENPRAFKRNHVIKSKLPVMWRANARTWVTRQFFMEWIHEVFAPSVKKYLQENDLPLRCLLVMDNTSAHPPGFVDELVGELGFITVKLLPPNVARFIQPMNQEVISSFKKLYTRALFQRCFEATSNSGITLREYWKQHFNILHCLTLIDKAWQEVTMRTMNTAWRNLWPDCVAEQENEIHEDSIIYDIVLLAKRMELEVDAEDIMELLEEHKQQLNTEELELLQRQQMEALAEELSPFEKNEWEDISSSLIKDICEKWGEVQNFVEKYHPDKAVASRSINIFNDNAMMYFRNVLNNKNKQNAFLNVSVMEQANESETDWEGKVESVMVKEEPLEQQQLQQHTVNVFVGDHAFNENKVLDEEVYS